MKRFSEILHQEIEINEAQKTITASDGTVYNRDELARLKNVNDDMKRTIHKLKKQFRGEVLNGKKT